MMIAAIISLLLASRSAWHHTNKKSDRLGKVCVRANSSIYIGKVASTKASAPSAAVRSEEKIEEECTLYYMVNFIIGMRASAVTTTSRHYCSAVSVTTAFVFAARRALTRSRRAATIAPRRLSNCGCSPMSPLSFTRVLDSSAHRRVGPLDLWSVEH